MFLRILFLMWVLCGAMTLTAHARRKNYVDASFEVIAGTGNQVGQSSSRLLSMNPFYSLYPSIELRSVGAHSNLDLAYTLLAERYEMSQTINSTAHALRISLASQLTARSQLRLSNTLNTAPDYSMINVLKGITPVPQEFQYVFDPRIHRRSSISDTAGVEFRFALTGASYIGIGSSISHRNYIESVADSNLSDQTRVEGRLGYSRRLSRHMTLDVVYRVWQNDYEEFSSTRSHYAGLGISREIGPATFLNISAGPAYTESSNVSYLVDLSLSKEIKSHHFSAGYSHRTSDSTGLGGASEIHQGTLTFYRALGRTIFIRFQAAAFRQDERRSGIHDFSGVRGAMAVTRQLGPHWFARIGGSYMGHDSYASKRFYVSLGYAMAGEAQTEP